VSAGASEEGGLAEEVVSAGVFQLAFPFLSAGVSCVVVGEGGVSLVLICSEAVMVVSSFSELVSLLSLQELQELRVSSSLSSSERSLVLSEIAERWREVCLSVSSLSDWRA